MNRKLVAITAALMLSLGACTTAQTGDGEYKKHYLGISDNVTYFVEQMDVLLSSGMSDDLMSKTVEEDWLVLV
jgi:hypothetical protein